MERSLLKLVNQTNMAARLNTKYVKPMYFPNFFGTKKVSTLTWETLVGDQGAPVIADVISFDASAPQKSREVIRKLSGDIPKTALKRGMNERDYNEYLRLRYECNGDADKLALLNLAFKDQDFVYNAVRGRMEWFGLQLLSRGGFALNVTNNNGLVTVEFVGCGMPKENRRVSTADWSNAATANGLQDIADTLEAASLNGRTIKYVVMHASDFLLLCKQKSTADTLKGWLNMSGRLTVTKDTINQYLATQAFPVQIVTVNPAVRIENSAHVRKTISPWERKRVAFLEDMRVGDIQHGPIAAENAPSVREKAMMVRRDFVLITKWSELSPFKEWTQAEANAMPVINDPDGLYILKTDGTAWAANEDTEGTDNVPAMLLGEEVEPESLKVEG
ncbi:major capsid protein E [Tannerella sp. oral taxon 808]|nr:major capsid protein E [Tannerella sp. oral taxon 808]